MAKLPFDKLNILSHEEYFAPMRISKEEKEIRVRLAEDLEVVFMLVFFLIESELFLNELEDIGYYSDFLYRHYMSVIEPYAPDISNEAKKEIKTKTGDIIKSTFRQIEDARKTTDNETDFSNEVESVLSNDRAVFDAQNKSNYVRNTEQIEKAIKDGYTKKEWLSMRDNRVRDTHWEVDGKIIPINDLFHVGGSWMAYPMDASHGASLSEIVGCRCSLEFYK